jgi:hypothetical protein
MKTQHARELATDAANWYLTVPSPGDEPARGTYQRAAVSVLVTVALIGHGGVLSGLPRFLALLNAMHTFAVVLSAWSTFSHVSHTAAYRADGRDPEVSGDG